MLGDCLRTLVVVRVELADDGLPGESLRCPLPGRFAPLRARAGDHAGSAVVDREGLGADAEERGDVCPGRRVPAVLEGPPAGVEDDEPGLAVLVNVTEDLREGGGGDVGHCYRVTWSKLPWFA